MRYFRNNKNGAEDEIRTRDPRLGKAMLYPEPLPHAFIIHMWSAKTIFCILSQMTHFVKGVW